MTLTFPNGLFVSEREMGNHLMLPQQLHHNLVNWQVFYKENNEQPTNLLDISMIGFYNLVLIVRSKSQS